MSNQEYNDDVNAYKQPSYQPYRNEDVGVFDWIITLIILAIPCLNFIMVFIWAFASSKASKRNFMRAKLIMMIIWIAIVIMLIFCFSGQLSEILYEINQRLGEVTQILQP